MNEINIYPANFDFKNNIRNSRGSNIDKSFMVKFIKINIILKKIVRLNYYGIYIKTIHKIVSLMNIIRDIENVSRYILCI